MRSYFKVVKSRELETYLNIEDECFIFMLKDDKELRLCKNTARELFRLRYDEFNLLACGSYDECTNILNYLKNTFIELYDSECNSYESVEMFGDNIDDVVKVAYSNYCFSIDDMSIKYMLGGLETPLNSLLRRLIKEVCLLMSDFNYKVEINYSDTSSFEVLLSNGDGKRLSLHGNPIISLLDFVRSRSLLIYNKIDKDYYLKELLRLRCTGDNNIPYEWAFVELDSRGKLVLNNTCEVDDVYSDFGTTSIFAESKFSLEDKSKDCMGYKDTDKDLYI